MKIEWSNRLTQTAGRTHYDKIFNLTTNEKNNTAKIELASKVIDCESKLRNTLAHEMCHVAVWVIENDSTPHGRLFKKYGQKIMAKFGDITVTTCHSYEIAYKYYYKCSDCGKGYGRHSKSIKVDEFGCGSCLGKLELFS